MRIDHAPGATPSPGVELARLPGEAETGSTPKNGGRHGPRRAGLPPLDRAGAAHVPTFVGGAGSHVVDADGRRYLDFGSQLVFTNLGHQHPRDRRRHQGAGRPAVHPGARPRVRHPRRSGAADRRGRAGGSRARAVHHRRHGGHRARRTDGAPAQRQTEGARRLPLLPRLDDDLDPPHRRPAPLGLGHRRGRRRPLLRPLPVPLGVRRRPPRRRNASGRSPISSR